MLGQQATFYKIKGARRMTTLSQFLSGNSVDTGTGTANPATASGSSTAGGSSVYTNHATVNPMAAARRTSLSAYSARDGGTSGGRGKPGSRGRRRTASLSGAMSRRHNRTRSTHSPTTPAEAKQGKQRKGTRAMASRATSPRQQRSQGALQVVIEDHPQGTTSAPSHHGASRSGSPHSAVASPSPDSNSSSMAGASASASAPHVKSKRKRRQLRVEQRAPVPSPRSLSPSSNTLRPATSTTSEPLQQAHRTPLRSSSQPSPTPLPSPSRDRHRPFPLPRKKRMSRFQSSPSLRVDATHRPAGGKVRRRKKRGSLPPLSPHPNSPAARSRAGGFAERASDGSHGGGQGEGSDASVQFEVTGEVVVDGQGREWSVCLDSHGNQYFYQADLDVSEWTLP